MTAYLDESADALPPPDSPEEETNRPSGTWRHVRRDPAFILGGAFLLILVLAALLAPWIAPHDPNAQTLSDRLMPPAWLEGGEANHLLGGSFLLILVLAALLAPWIAPHDPNAQTLSDRLMPPVWLEGGEANHLLGTDNLGRDVFSRLLYGARLSLLIATLVTLVAGGLGTLLGLLVGYLRGWPERLVMGWIDLQVSFPVILLIILIITVVGPSVTTLVVCISLTHWLIYTRTTRSAVLSVSQSQYVAAAEVAGGSTWRILSRHVLPNLVSPLLTLVLLEFATVILVEAALSFLGLGIQPPHTSWGLDVSIGKEYIFNAWWLVTFPGLAIAFTVLALNFVSSSLRSALDPTARATKLLAQVGGQ